MKKIILICSLLAIAALSNAQVSWKIKLGGKILLQAPAENEVLNNKKIRSSQLSSKNSLVLSYVMTPDENDWTRTLMIDDSTGAGVLIDPPVIKKGKTEASFTLTGKKLKELLLKYRTLKFYYTSIPSDPKKAMLVRVRKVHICTISL